MFSQSRTLQEKGGYAQTIPRLNSMLIVQFKTEVESNNYLARISHVNKATVLHCDLRVATGNLSCYIHEGGLTIASNSVGCILFVSSLRTKCCKTAK